MCGIIGYVGQREASPILLEGLKKLEYRGYDSAGMAVKDEDNKINMIKDVGKVDEINSKHNFLKLRGKIGCSHNRWSTHGGVTKENAHPHLSNNRKISIVHNGIIENYQELREMLQKEGFKFYSETDTEVIPNLIELEMRGGKDYIEAAKSALLHLEGSYALVALNEDDNRLIAARKGSPLVIGIGDGEYFAASDIPAFLKHTKNVVYLYDNDFVVLPDMKIYNLKQKSEVMRPVDTISWNAEKAERGEFNHFLLKEITEQADTIQNAIDQDERFILDLVEEVKSSHGLFFVGCGTAYHACLSGSYIFSKIAKEHVNVVLASEFPHFEYFLTDKTLVIAVSQSGETADVLEAVKAAKKKGAKVISVVNVQGSSLHRESDVALLTKAGPEICVLSTKAYTSQLAVLTLLAYAIAGRLEEGKAQLKNLHNLIYNLTSANAREHIKKVAELLKDKNHIFTIGRGILYPTALEAALKIKEVSYIHTEGFAGGELKHGTIALIERGTPCIVFASEENEKETISNAMEIKSRGGFIIGVAPKNNPVFDIFIKVPEVGICDPICHVIPAQILAYQLAILRGCDPDMPRNLAKSVTVK